MFLALIGCSACPDEVEIAVADLDELDHLNCECGYGYVLLAVGLTKEERWPRSTPQLSRR